MVEAAGREADMRDAPVAAATPATIGLAAEACICEGLVIGIGGGLLLWRLLIAGLTLFVSVF
jgi:hypothetical protein